MNEETTTSTQVDDSAANATTEEATTEQAVQGTEETSETTSSESAEGESASQTEETEDDTKAWAEKKGLPLDDPIAMAKMIREGDKKVTEATQKATELGKSVETASTEIGATDIQALNNKIAVMEFYQTFPDAKQLDTEMATTLEAKPYLANDLEALYFYVKGQQADRDLVAARQAGSKEALAATAQAERAAAPKASATERTTPNKLTNDDIRNMSITEYQAAVAEGKIQPFAQ